MLSIFSGFENDILISYRHNDNKYDGWVTEFAGKLNQQLDTTLKDRLSIFFDTIYTKDYGRHITLTPASRTGRLRFGLRLKCKN